ncbi:hypothetical protein DFJ74DRAFT_693584 [Hyaloraphidium curvatum]|nr:hypothetical protein DFJ74DRAFT_693584 [Hyaloraphidium curvatum]
MASSASGTGVAIPGSRTASAAGALSSSLLQHEDSIYDAITVAPANISTSPFNSALENKQAAKKTLLILNASSWIGQAHLGVVSQQSIVADENLRVMSPAAGPGFNPFTYGNNEDAVVNPGGFYVGSPPPMKPVDAAASNPGLAQSPSTGFLPGLGVPKRGSVAWASETAGADMSAGGKLRVIAAYRSASKMPQELPAGIDKLVQVDFDVPSSIDAAFEKESVDYVYIIPSYSANRAQQTSEIVQACLRHRRVRYIVLLSLLAPKHAAFTGRAGGGEAEFPVHKEFRELERMVAKSGITHTFLRVGIFHHQLFEICRRSAEWTVENNPAEADVISLGLPLKIGTVAPVDVRDVAQVSSHLFASFPQHPYLNQPVDITGPQLLSGTALVGAMSKGLGRPVRYANVSTVDFAQFLTRVGLAGTVRDVEAICGLWATAGRGEWAYLGADMSQFSSDPKRKKGIPLAQHFEERKEEIASIVLQATPADSAPSSPSRLSRSNSVLGSSAPISLHARRPSIPSPLLGDLSLGAHDAKKPTPPPTVTPELPNPSSPTTTWWTPGHVEGKIGVHMSPAEWLKRYGPSAAVPSPQKFAGNPHGFVDGHEEAHPELIRNVADMTIGKK